jgi:hypothetical protein
MSEKLKSCPFCGADEAWCWEYEENGKHAFVVRCKICEMGGSGYRCREGAEEAWNRRVTQ